MEQIAVVKTVLANGMAKIAVERETACGAAHSCSECAGCEKMMTRTENVVTAYNDARANPGDVVKVRSENAAFFKTAAIVYLLPLALLLAAILWDRHMKKVNGLRFHIVEVKRTCSGM